MDPLHLFPTLQIPQQRLISRVAHPHAPHFPSQ